MSGNACANLLQEGAGNDTLDGGDGADALVSGANSDFYHVRQIGDAVVEAAGGAYDYVYACIDG